MADQSTSAFNVETVVGDILQTIEREREREIVSRRFGLYDRKETLEQIGELLGITRERVRQLEKAIVLRLKEQAKSAKLPHLKEVQVKLVKQISDFGQTVRVSDLTEAVVGKGSTKIDQSRVAFLGELCHELAVIDDNDFYYQALAVSKVHDSLKVKAQVNKIIEAIKKRGEPVTIEVVAEDIKNTAVADVRALASISKELAALNGVWGLIRWPMVNPKNIRDKIYVILKQKGQHMHFNEIAEAIKDSTFKRKDVTTQAIHNELIKDKRFVLIGRGIYALKEWGYEKGTVADIISDVLKKAGQPLHRDEIVKRVLKSRYVKETTILLNLQGKPQFKRVAKATYALEAK